MATLSGRCSWMIDAEAVENSRQAPWQRFTRRKLDGATSQADQGVVMARVRPRRNPCTRCRNRRPGRAWWEFISISVLSCQLSVVSSGNRQPALPLDFSSSVVSEPLPLRIRDKRRHRLRGRMSICRGPGSERRQTHQISRAKLTRSNAYESLHPCSSAAKRVATNGDSFTLACLRPESTRTHSTADSIRISATITIKVAGHDRVQSVVENQTRIGGRTGCQLRRVRQKSDARIGIENLVP